MVVRYVSPQGNDGNSGLGVDPANAWLTINRAVQSDNIAPGDQIMVLPGTYSEEVKMTKPGVAGAYVRLRSLFPRLALIRSPAASYSAVQMSVPFCSVEDFDVQCGAGFGSGIDNTYNSPKSHHLAVRGNYVHDCDGGGINLAWGDRFLIEGNEVAKCAGRNNYQTSGITIYQPQSLDTLAGFHNIIRGNISRDNAELGFITNEHTDGNGIIIDDGQNTQQSGSQSVPYQYATLVTDNLMLRNGGTGGHSFKSDNVHWVKNTSVVNNYDNANTATWRGAIANYFSSNNRFLYNICVADSGKNPNNTAAADCSVSPVSGNYWQGNFLFDISKPGDPSFKMDNPTPPVVVAHLYGMNPRFANDYGLELDSPATGLGYTPRPISFKISPEVRASLNSIISTINKVIKTYG